MLLCLSKDRLKSFQPVFFIYSQKHMTFNGAQGSSGNPFWNQAVMGATSRQKRYEQIIVGV